MLGRWTGSHFDRSAAPAISIVGCGFSGAAIAVSLLDRMREPIHLAIYNAAGSPGTGLAYGRARPEDLLNVRASAMRLYADREGDFAQWLSRKAASGAMRFGADDFVPRRLFGDYVRERLAEAIAANPSSSVDFIDGEAIAISRSGRRRFRVHQRRSGGSDADCVVLATGYGARRRERYGFSPYEPIPEDAFDGAEAATIIGAGLTAVDVALDLAKNRPALHITMISRRGRLPLAHARHAIGDTFCEEPAGDTALALLRSIRNAVRETQGAGGDWRAVINGLRPHTQELWRALPPAEKQRFARRLKIYWDIHRHRLPPENAARLEALVRTGRIAVIAGDVARAADEPGALAVRLRGTSVLQPIAPGPVIDCAGFGPDLDAPAVKSLLTQELAFRDDVGVGLRVDEKGRLLDQGAGVIKGLYAIGPLGAGSLLEVTAAPEIAVQAFHAAKEIQREIGGAIDAKTRDSLSMSH